MKTFSRWRWVLCLGLLFSAFASAAPLSEQQKIDQLILKVETLPGAQFIRNGSAHDGKAAAEHLQTKRKYAGDKIKTASDFIENCATRSSITGLPYLIQFADGRTEEAGVFLHAQLKLIETAAAAGATSAVAAQAH